MHIPDPTHIDKTFIQAAVDGSLQTLTAEKRRKEDFEEEANDEPLSKRFKIGESFGAGGSTEVTVEGEAQPSTQLNSPTPKDAEVVVETAVEGENQPETIQIVPKNTDTLTTESEEEEKEDKTEEEEKLDYGDSPIPSEAERSEGVELESSTKEEAHMDKTGKVAAENVAAGNVVNSAEVKAAAGNVHKQVPTSTTLITQITHIPATEPITTTQQVPHKPTLELIDQDEIER